jgi:peptidoglycan L-alanyl-D-glutamate endopeptidase CwlK
MSNYKERSLAIINSVEPHFGQILKLWFETCEFSRKPIYIYCGVRTPNEQSQLYAQGRTIKGKIVTNAKPYESWHNYGLAIDFCLVDRNGKISWDTNADFDNNKQSDYAEVIKFAEKLGLESGSKFKFVDMPHIQFRHGLTIQEAKKRLLSGNLVNGFIKVR